MLSNLENDPEGLTLYTFNLNLDHDSKTSKRILNMNAVKFRLMTLNSKTIRYEVIYKNLVRDIRKFYS